jgi:hypothetical protein
MFMRLIRKDVDLSGRDLFNYLKPSSLQIIIIIIIVAVDSAHK